MTSLLGMHWIRTHPDGRDLAHIERMQYKSVKLFEWHWNNRDACRDLLTVLPQNAYILARDHPLSEQKQDVWNDPVGTGTRHANDWAMKVASGNVHTPVDRTFFLGANELDATSGDRNAIDLYTATFLDRLRTHGLRGGGFNFSTGHPRTVDGTGSTAADYSVFERSRQAIVRGFHVAVLHIYGTAATPCVPGHFDRLKACTWQDVEWVVGECGPDEHVIGGGNHDGYLISMKPNVANLCPWLDSFILGVNDQRIHSFQVYTYDFSHPWASFDTRAIRDALESYDWQHTKQAPPITTHLPSVPAGKTEKRYVNVRDGANLRTSPGDGDVLIAVPFTTIVEVSGYANGPDGWTWARSRYEGYTGYIRADLLNVMQPTAEPTLPPPPQPAPTGNEWERSIAFVRRWEGGYVDDPNDPGGATNKGITLATFKRWRASQGQPEPTKDDLRALTDAEANQIYLEWYWRASGADQLPWPLCLAHFDTAVNAGTGRAKEMLERSNGVFLAYMGHLIDWYTRIPNFEHFGRAWIRRRADILLEASK